MMKAIFKFSLEKSVSSFRFFWADNEIFAFYSYVRVNWNKQVKVIHTHHDLIRHSIFNGNIIRGSGFVFAYILVALLTDLGLLFCILNNNRYTTQDSRSILLITIVMYVLSRIYILFSIRIGRHPEKYSRKIVTLFFKEKYVRIYNKQR